MAALEDRLKTKLFYRTTRNLSPTHAGKKLYLHAQNLLEHIERVEYELDLQNRLRGHLKITASAAFTQIYLQDAISQYLTLNPEVTIEVIATDRNVNITENGIDLAIRHGTSKDSSLIIQKLTESKRVLCASPQYLAVHGAPSSPLELTEHQKLTVGNEISWVFRKGDTREQVKLKPIYSSTLGDSVLKMAELGHGLTVQSDWHAKKSLSDGKLVKLLPDWNIDPAIAVNVLYPSRKNQSLITRNFISFLKDWIAKNPLI